MTNAHDNKTYLVTGGTTGIGAATVAHLANAGANVIATGRSPETLEAAKESAPANVEFLISDAGDTDAIGKLAEHLQATYGKIDGAFLNAGIAPFAPLEGWTEDQFDKLFAINVKGPFFLAQKLIPLLNEGGSLVFNTSMVHESGMGAAAAYGGTKGALRSIVRSLSVELAEQGIRVNAVAPGPIQTPIYGKTGMDKAELDGFAAQLASRVPLKRFGSGEDIAQATAFLLSGGAGFITGEELVVDGGLLNNVA
ncbi:MAG: SDR family oxidoreductase [Pseudomonadota bacterium]